MKRLLTIILIMTMLLPAAALAVDQDPIVGTWYTYTGIVEDPELRKQAYFEFSTFHFTEDGNIFSSTYDVSEEGITTCKDFKVIGLWTKDNGIYYVNIGFNGATELSFDKNDIFFPVSTYSIRLHRLTPINYTLDIKK